VNYEAAGPSPVGHEVFTLEDAARGRTLTVQVWYPADEGARAAAAAGVPLEELVPEGPDRDLLKGLVAVAPERCTTRKTGSAAGATPGAGTFPLVVFSHCHGCLRFSALSVAERLASHGIAVIAPDHAGGTLFDAQAGKLADINDTFLETRSKDVSFVLDAALDAGNGQMPAALRGRFDGAKLGMMGHSFGAATTGKVLQDDVRFKAGFAMAAPPAFLGGVEMAKIEEPIFLLLAQEDNSIGVFGNKVLRDNFKAAVGPAWLAEVADAGHWSFSDICALTEGLKPGCGQGKRQTDKTDFSYLDIDVGRGIAEGYAAAYFARWLGGDAGAEGYLGAGHPADRVQVQKK